MTALFTSAGIDCLALQAHNGSLTGMGHISKYLACLVIALLAGCSGFLQQHTYDDPAFIAWSEKTIDDAANEAGKAVAEKLHIENEADVAIIKEGIRNATGEAAIALRAALEKQGEDRRAALRDWAGRFLTTGSQVAGAAGGATGNPLLLALGALLAAGAGAVGGGALKKKSTSNA
jgi:hypothetical protein